MPRDLVSSHRQRYIHVRVYKTSPTTAKTTHIATLKAVAGACSLAAPPVYVAMGSPVALVHAWMGLPVPTAVVGQVLDASGTLFPLVAATEDQAAMFEPDPEPEPDPEFHDPVPVTVAD